MWILNIRIRNITLSQYVVVSLVLRWMMGIRWISFGNTYKLVSVHFAEVDSMCARSARSLGLANSPSILPYLCWVTADTQRGTECLYNVWNNLLSRQQHVYLVQEPGGLTLPLSAFYDLSLLVYIERMAINGWRCWNRGQLEGGGFDQVQSKMP